MKRLWLSLSTLLFSPALLAQEANGLDAKIDALVRPVADAISSVIFYSVSIGGQALPLVVVWLVVAATVFTFYFGFINVRGFAHGFRLIRGDYSDPNAKGEVSHFQALATAVSGTVGLGNIAGVAIAVSIGGPGATFWMILAGILGMSSKFCECTLGVKFRNEYADGSVSGGPMYYLSKGLAEKGPGMAKFGKLLAVFFAICCIGGSFGGGNMFQSNQAFLQLIAVTGGADSGIADKGWLFGLIIAAVVAVTIIGGIRSIARVTEKVVPFMAALYIICGMAVIAVNIDAVPAAFGQIFQGAMSPEATYGGIIGVLIVGFQRAAFSNEAGIGSASIAHSAVKTDHPVTEGLVAIYEPFIDTVVICTITALVIIVTGSYDPSGQMSGVDLTSSAFETVISWFPYLLTIAVVLFAFSTMLAWSYYGLKSWTYLFGESAAMDITYKLLFCAFVIIGATMNLGSVVGFSDAMIFAMAFPNIIGLYILMPKVKEELNDYWQALREGRIRNFREERLGRATQS
ncbi:MAG: alanine/glycine:cation symporter family protein [Pseudomonadota bacterium]